MLSNNYDVTDRRVLFFKNIEILVLEPLEV